MRSPNYLIVEADREYLNEIDTGKVKIIVNTTIESVANINRKVKVVSAPQGLLVKPGDEVIIHHNILRRNNGVKGTELISEYWLKDNLFYVPVTEVFAYCREGKWSAIDPFCFVKPVKYQATEEDKLLSQTAVFKEKTHKGMACLKGELVFSNKVLESQGVIAGNIVYFSTYSEYEFDIAGQIVYKMSTRDIVAVE